MDMSNQQESDSARLTTSQKAQGMSRSSVVVVGCMVALFVIGIVIIIVVLSLDENDDNDNEIHTSLGDDLWSSYTIFNSLPHTTGEAVASGWVAVSGCQAGLGILYAKEITGPSPASPLALRFTEYGQVTGVQVSVFGSNSIGNAAQDRLVDDGFWRTSAFNSSGGAWAIDVSFRDEDDMCSDEELLEPLGDRLVVNQDSIAWSVPLTRDGAEAAMFTSGSCMDTMGQHYFYDVETAPVQSYKEDQLLPIVPMYWPLDSTGTINAFFITTPVQQPGTLPTGAADWEPNALPPPYMCQNWCDDENCDFETPAWSTMHIYLNSQFSSIVCPNGVAPTGRSCDFT